MNFLANECLPQFMINVVQALGHDVQDFKREKPQDRRVADHELAALALQRGRILLTQDSAVRHGHWQVTPDHPGIITIRVKNRDMAFLTRLLKGCLASLDENLLRGNIAVLRRDQIVLFSQNQPRQAIPLRLP